MADIFAMIVVHFCAIILLRLRGRFLLNKAVYDIEKCP
jgi:hypothetical protein